MKTVKHSEIVPGLYLANTYKPKGLFTKPIYTYDCRFILPNNEENVYLDKRATHTIEHLIAQFIKDPDIVNPKIGESISWNPMGCMTGFYWEATVKPEYALDMMVLTIQAILNYKGPIPFSTREECGNYKFHNNAKAIGYLKQYLKVLLDQSKTRLETEKPQVIDYKELTQN